MKILFVAAESYPFIKTGGLGDVAYALPKALRNMGIDARVIIPKYGNIPEKFKDKMVTKATFDVPIAWRNQYCGLQYMEYDSVPFYFVDNEYYFRRDGAYGHGDDGERFAYFPKAVLEAIKYMDDFKPDIIHCNDWHTGPLAVFLKAYYMDWEDYARIKTVFTIHNLQYQGVFPQDILENVMGLSNDYFTEETLKFYDKVSYMKGGLMFSDIITTVSPTYAEEIKYPYFGEHLEGIMNSRSSSLYGILNGIDFEVFNPETDKNIDFNYNVNTLEGKGRNKLELQKRLGLASNENIPVIGMVTRLASQKGLDLLSCVIDDILQNDVQFVVLGTGEQRYEDMFRYYAWKYPNKVSANIFFDNVLAEKIYASSDMFLMPSQFEPCGLGQLIALRYGTIPIVRETGGLKDTVKSFNELTGEGNGFSFTNYNAHDMLYTINRAISYYHDKAVWPMLVKRGMEEDNSWEKSAREYVQVYKKLLY